MVHGFFYHMPNWGGFALLMVVWVLFRSFLLRGRRSTMQRMRSGQSMPPPVPPQMHGQVRCPRCSAAAPAVASFCPHCGLAIDHLPPPIPPAQYVQRPARNALLWLIYVLLGVIGLAAFAYWRSGGWSDDQPPASPERPHVRLHEYYR